jgi:4-hydroxy-3-polyprenylbenzoate decarboxylase
MKDVFFDDLRALIDALDKAGNLKRINGAHWNLEIGTINEILALQNGPSALFDKIPDYPKGYRVLSNVFQNEKGQKIAFGMDEQASSTEIIKDWADKFMRFKPLPPKYVSTGPIMENVISGQDINILKFPVPKWHEMDGGRYIGTANCVISKDPDEDFCNVGTYRQMVQNENTLNIYSSPGKHFTIMRDKYWGKGRDCPVVLSFGQDPLLLGFAMITIPWGMSEFEAAGFFKRRPIEVIKGPLTGLPIPATAEIAVECLMSPGEEMVEGPFGEWTGYYATGARKSPIAKIKAIYHRNDPILHGQPPVPPPANTWFPIPVHTAPTLWNNLVAASLQGIKGVYIHGPGNRPMCVISIQQKYIGHAKQVATVAAGLLTGGACVGKWIIVVDDDIDPSNFEQVWTAICLRADIENSIDIVRGYLNSSLDPSLSPEKKASGDITTAKVIINACKPWHWKDKFPRPINVSEKLIQEAKKKFSDALK